jgi:hypothetical protein
MAQVVECLPNKYKTQIQNTILHTHKNKKRKKGRKKKKALIWEGP